MPATAFPLAVRADNTPASRFRCLDYGLSFICGTAAHNSVRLWVESRTTIFDDKAGTATEYFQCASCKSEDTFAKQNLFYRDNECLKNDESQSTNARISSFVLLVYLLASTTAHPTEPVSYYVVNNDRIVQLSSGRLLVAAADHSDISKRPNSPAVCYVSDDDGKTWRRGPGAVRLGGIGCQEPGVVELKDGRVYMIIRNSLGTIQRAISTDGGLTWGEPASTGLKSPAAPATITRIPSTGDLLMVWNNSATDRRVPLTAAVSSDEGQTWSHVRDLETDGQSFAYTSVTWVRDTAVLSHWTQMPGGFGLKVKVVPVKWFYEK